MSFTCKFLKVLSLMAALVAFAAPAMAQEVPPVEVSGGYNLVHFESETFSAGWYADVAGNVTPAFAIVGQVTGNYKTVEEDGISIDAKVHSFMAGVRVNARATGGVTPFAQALFGASRLSGSSDLSGALPFSVGVSETDATLQLGGGVKFMPGNVGLQVGADYLRIFAEDEATNAFRFAAGVVYGF